MRRRFLPSLAAALMAVWGLASLVTAHEMGVIQVQAILSPGSARIEIRVDAEHAPPGFVEEIPRQFRILFDQRPVEFRFSQRAPGPGADPARLLLEAAIPAGAKEFSFTCDSPIGPFPIRVEQRAGPGESAAEAVTDWQVGAAQGRRVALSQTLAPPSTGRIVGDYLVLGFTHIVPKGADHILFVVGLFLLSSKWRPLLSQVTAFTLAHTLTLGLSMAGVISLSPRIVEPLIALSIVAVAVENLWTQEARPRRLALVFGFGLLHGMGFAGVLAELGLPRRQALPALLSFNLGVELGQLAVLAAAMLLIGLPFGRWVGYRRWLTLPASLAIGVVGLYWAIERLGW